MKMACYLSIATVGLFVAATGACADPAAPDPRDNPDFQVDPDGVPLSLTQPKNQQLSGEQLKEARNHEEKAALDRDWLLRNYEHELQAHAAADSTGGDETNLYYELTSNKDLARLAGLPTLGSDDRDNVVSSPTGEAPSNPGGETPSAETSSRGTGNPSSWQQNLFKPAISPFSVPGLARVHNFYALPPVSMGLALPGNFQTSPAPGPDQSRESSDMETPGMVAAEKDPLTDARALDLSLDRLPGESIEQARAHQDNNLNLELPIPMDVDQLHKEEAASLSVPGASKTAQPAASPQPATVKAAPTEDPNAPLPVSKALQINPVRSPIANPYDILDP
ncbi:MAG TPA: hypothetical protein VGZ93_05175 [Candidatus Methylacidiphilales bacterium]|jgi:hypothetical protein|nr:hypothetical protein [Candidatus Methylacidiphilales bacterium]